MVKQRGDQATLDLLRDFRPPEIAERFEEAALVKASHLSQRISRCVSRTLTDSGLGRDEIAGRMSDYLTETVSKHMLDAYASEARDDHNISLERAAAMVHATGDPRLFGDLLGRLGYAVIPERYLAAVEDAMITEQIETLKKRQPQLRRRWKDGLP